MRNVGDKVWVPKARLTNIESVCPDCLGKAQWHCTLPSGEEFDVECPRCYPGGYDRSTGKVKEEWEFIATAVQSVIIGMRIDGDKVEYTTTGNYVFEEHEVCDTKEQAEVVCHAKAQEYVDSQNNELKRIAKSKGRPRKGLNGEREASDDFGGRTIVYARSQIRSGLKEAIKWAKFAERHGVKHDLAVMLQEQIKKG